MGKGGGGSASTAGLEQVVAEQTALQKQIYEEGREDIQPWYQMGTGAVSQLSDLLGISGGSVKTEDQIRAGLQDQYTTQQTSSTGNTGFYTTPDGRVMSESDALNSMGLHGIADGAHYLTRSGYTPMGSSSTQSVVDNDGLNAAVQAQLAEQGIVPDNYGSLLEKFDESKMQDSAGYQFRKEQGQKALERSMAAQGITLGGAGFGDVNSTAAQGLMDFGQGLASQEYQNEYSRYTNDQLNTFNMLMGASGSGQQATSQMAQSGQNYATNVGNLQTGLAQAQYGAAQANASKPSMFGQLLGTAAQIAPSLIAASDKNVKENIEYTHMDNGHKMYNFNYIGDDKLYNGVMAQDVLKTNPEAVVKIGNVLHVAYGNLGVKMTEVK